MFAAVLREACSDPLPSALLHSLEEVDSLDQDLDQTSLAQLEAQQIVAGVLQAPLNHQQTRKPGSPFSPGQHETSCLPPAQWPGGSKARMLREAQCYGKACASLHPTQTRVGGPAGSSACCLDRMAVIVQTLLQRDGAGVQFLTVLDTGATVEGKQPNSIAAHAVSIAWSPMADAWPPRRSSRSGMRQRARLRGWQASLSLVT